MARRVDIPNMAHARLVEHARATGLTPAEILAALIDSLQTPIRRTA